MTFSLRAQSGEPEDTPETAVASESGPASEPGPASGGDPEPAAETGETAEASETAETGEAGALCPTPIGDALGLLESCDLSLVSDGTAAAAAAILPADSADVWPLVSVSDLAALSELSENLEDLEDLVLPQAPGFEINEIWPALVLAGGGGLILLALLTSGGSDSDDSGGGAPANRGPASVESAPATLTAMEGEATSWDVKTWFSDPDGEVLSFAVSGLPDGGWLVLEAMTGALTIAELATDDAEVGVYTLAVTASDEADSTAVHTVKLTVENVAEAPATTTLAPTSASPLSAMEGTAASWDVAAWFSDPDPAGTPGDMDSLTFTVSGLPDGGWLTWDSDTNGLAIAAEATNDAEVGAHTFVITATDGTDLEATHTVTLAVENVAEPPTTTTLAPNVSLSAVEGVMANWNVSTWFSDPDAGDSLTFTAVLPGWLVLNDTTGALTIAPGATDDAQTGMHTLTVTATDKAGAMAAHTVELTVLDVPEPPTTTTLAPTAPLSAMEGIAADWDVSAWFSDPDAGDSLTFTVSGLPDGGWLTWDGTSELAIAAGMTDDAQVGMYTLTVTASDTTSPTALTAVHTVTLDVENVPESPVVVTGPSAPPTMLPEVKEGVAADWDVSDWFSDEDTGDVLTYTGMVLQGAVGSQTTLALPEWLELDEATGSLTIAEAATDDPEIGTHTLAITARDTTALTAVHMVTLTITDIVHEPLSVLSTLSSRALSNRIAPATGMSLVLDGLADFFTDVREDGSTETLANEFTFEVSSSIDDTERTENIITAAVTGSMLVLTPGAASGANGELWHQETVTITAVDEDGGRGVVSFAVSTRANVLDVGTLASRHGFIIRGDEGRDNLGYSASRAGDVNGDGLADLIVGARWGGDGDDDAGEAYIIYGKADPDTGDGAAGTQFGAAEKEGAMRQFLDTTHLAAADGFVIQGDAAYDNLGESVSAAGDVNGDGLADLIVGAHQGRDGGTNAGEAYIIYGKAGTTGTQFGEAVALSVSVNTDMEHPVTTTITTTLGEGDSAPADSVVRRVLDTTELAPAAGFIIQGDVGGDYLGKSVSGLGDINGDGLADLIVGAYRGGDGGTDAGEAYIVYGKVDADGDGTQFGSTEGVGMAMRQVLDTTDLAAADGFILLADAAGDRLGWSVSGAGDINGDGLADLIVGALYGDDGGNTFAGEAYIVYGKIDADGDGTQFGTAEMEGEMRQVLDTTKLAPAEGFVLQGDRAFDQLGWSVSGAGDINGDGLDDLIVGANVGSDGGTSAGEAYIIYGKAGTDGTQFGMEVRLRSSGRTVTDNSEPSNSVVRQVLDTSLLAPADGFILQGDVMNDQLGYSVSGAGDINGDGLADLIVGALGGFGATGKAYIVYGKAGTDGTQFGMAVSGPTGESSPLTAFAQRQVLDTTGLAPTDGFILQGAAGDFLGGSVSGAGDVNGDGFDDLIAGAHFGDDGGPSAGEAYIVYGGTHLGEVVSHAQTLEGGASDMFLLGGAGDDDITAHGDTRVLYGGAGDDTLELVDDSFRRVDGGSGVDTLGLGSGVTLDLTDVGDRGRLRGIEVVSLSDATALVTLDLAAVYALVEARDNGDTLTDAGEVLLRLEVEDGVSGAMVTLEGSWVEMEVADGPDLYTLGSARLLADDGLDVVVMDMA